MKLENLQPINAYKLRGAVNAVAMLWESQRQRGVWTISAGNAGQGVAYAARRAGVPCTVVAIETAPEAKLQRMRRLGAKLILVSYDIAWRALDERSFPGAEGTFIHPFDDDNFIAGHGTMGLEILEDLPNAAAVIASIGGGGLITGVGSAIKASNPTVKVIGVEPELGADAQASLRAGQVMKFPAEQVLSTIADGLRAQFVGTLTFEHIRRYVDDVVTVSEEEIMQAVRILSADPQTMAEPSGAVASAAWLFHPESLPDPKNTVAIISGGKGDAASKIEAMRSAGIRISLNPAALGTTLLELLSQ